MSPEYPDLPFASPAAYGRGRDGKAVRYIVVHYTAGGEGPTSAEDGAAYDRRRTDGTSTHYFVDSNSVFQEVVTTDRANAALSKGNRLGIQYELCGTEQNRGQWLDPVSDATLTNAARQMARDATKYGIPVRRLSVAEVRAAWYGFPNGPKGFCGHADVTLAYPEDGGDHMDPGREFPWDVLLSRVQYFVSGGNDVAIDEGNFNALIWRVEALAEGRETVAGGPRTGEPMKIVQELHAIRTAIAAGGVQAPALVDALKLALADPAVMAALVEAARQGANLAEDG